MKTEIFKLVALTLIALTLSFGSSFASAKDKQDAEAETKILAIPAMKIRMSKHSVLNVSRSLHGR